MPQPATIIEWWGPYQTLEKVREANAWGFQVGGNAYVFCMALGEESAGEDASRYRFLTSWQQSRDGEAKLPADDRLSDAGNKCFYLGLIASFRPGTHRQTAEWALVRALRPELNGPPNPYPPAGPGQYCGSVCSWFYSPDGERKIEPPPGFPTVITFNSPKYDDPPDEERVLRLRLG